MNERNKKMRLLARNNPMPYVRHSYASEFFHFSRRNRAMERQGERNPVNTVRVIGKDLYYDHKWITEILWVNGVPVNNPNPNHGSWLDTTPGPHWRGLWKGTATLPVIHGRIS